jgi:Na+/proline symporter
MLYLDQPLGGGAIILLLIVLAISVYIGVRHLSRIRASKSFLIVDHKARGFDILASQAAYYMSLAAGVALVPALAFDF